MTEGDALAEHLNVDMRGTSREAGPVYSDASVTLFHGDCIEVMRTLADDSVDAVVTDPPYGLGFMGQDWDSPGGTGDFPMRRFDAMNMVNTGASRQGGRQRSTEDFAKRQSRDARAYGEWCEQWAAECLRVLKPGGHLLAFGGTRTYHRIAAAVEDVGFELRDCIAWLYGSGFPKSRNLDGDWQGWGTALKPAHEPIVVARKSCIGTVAANVDVHGTGAIHIDACRTALPDGEVIHVVQSDPAKRSGLVGTDLGISRADLDQFQQAQRDSIARTNDLGRWPTNVVLDDEAAQALDEQTGTLSSGANPTRRGSDKFRDAYGEFKGQEECVAARGADSGGASRFYPVFHYEAKAAQHERPRDGDVAHPTVKPLDLMRWLVRLVTPPGGLVLEPFAGSGTTAEACVIEGMRCVAIEQHEPYLALITGRLTKPIQPTLGGVA